MLQKRADLRIIDTCSDSLRELRGAPAKSQVLVALMFVPYIVGLLLLAASFRIGSVGGA